MWLACSVKHCTIKWTTNNAHVVPTLPHQSLLSADPLVAPVWPFCASCPLPPLEAGHLHSVAPVHISEDVWIRSLQSCLCQAVCALSALCRFGPGGFGCPESDLRYSRCRRWHCSAVWQGFSLHCPDEATLWIPWNLGSVLYDAINLQRTSQGVASKQWLTWLLRKKDSRVWKAFREWLWFSVFHSGWHRREVSLLMPPLVSFPVLMFQSHCRKLPFQRLGLVGDGRAFPDYTERKGGGEMVYYTCLVEYIPLQLKRQAVTSCAASFIFPKKWNLI